MKKVFFGFIFHKLMGWTGRISVALPDKCIIAIAPHTSNWDFLIGELFAHTYGWKSKFMMKKEWFFWPLRPLLKKMGGIPINRGRKTSTVEQTVEMAKNTKTFHLGITPEGTRKPNPNWKHGFYYIALGAKIPIVPVAIDYRTKSIVAEMILQPGGDATADMRKIKRYFSRFTGKHSENFAV